MIISDKSDIYLKFQAPYMKSFLIFRMDDPISNHLLCFSNPMVMGFRVGNSLDLPRVFDGLVGIIVQNDLTGFQNG